MHGNVVTEVRVAQLDPTQAAFVGSPDMSARFARMNFKLRDEWFDVEGVVVAKWTGAGACMCRLMFSAMSAAESARLERALRDKPSTTSADLGFPRTSREVSRPRVEEPPALPSAGDVKRLFREALEDLAV